MVAKCLMLMVLFNLLIGWISSNPWAAEQDIIIQAQVEPQQPILQQQVIYTLRVYRDSHLQWGHFLTPVVPQAIVRFKQSLPARPVKYMGREYELLEQQYYLYPQQSGEIILPPPVFSSHELFVKGESVKLIVAPALNADEGWLVADQLRLNEHWNIPLSELQSGQIIEREIQIEAENTLSIFLPQFELPEIDGIGMQRLPAELSDQGNLAKRIERIRYILQKPGDYQIPAVSIRWWNSQNKQFQYVQIEAQDLRIGGGQGIVVEQPALPIKVEELDPKLEHSDYNWKQIYFYLIVVTLLAVLIFLAVYYQLYKRLKNLVARWQIQRQLTKACKNNNARTVYDLLNQLFSGSMDNIGYQVPNQERLSKELQAELWKLDKSLFAAKATEWSGERALPYLKQLFKKKLSFQGNHRSVLKPMWNIK